MAIHTDGRSWTVAVGAEVDVDFALSCFDAEADGLAALWCGSAMNPDSFAVALHLSSLLAARERRQGSEESQNLTR